MSGNLIADKSYAFALRIVKMYKYLIKEHKEYDLARQVLRSGTSIGANVEEGIGGQSHNDFIAKMFIAYKDARETHYWIRLLKDSDYLNDKIATSLLKDCEEILKILGKILKTAKENKKK